MTKDYKTYCVYNDFRKDWQLLRVLQIFVEHTLDYLPSVTIVSAKRMKKVRNYIRSYILKTMELLYHVY